MAGAEGEGGRTRGWKAVAGGLEEDSMGTLQLKEKQEDRKLWRILQEKKEYVTEMYIMINQTH